MNLVCAEYAIDKERGRFMSVLTSAAEPLYCRCSVDASSINSSKESVLDEKVHKINYNDVHGQSK